MYITYIRTRDKNVKRVEHAKRNIRDIARGTKALE